jgi:exopolysaccharide biosynthesis protein
VAFARGEADADEPRMQKVVAVRIDLQAPGIEFLATPDNGKAPRETTSETTSQFLARHHLQVAINANFFDPCCAEGDKDLLGLAVSRGVVVSPARVTGIGAVALCITKDNHAHLTRTGPAFSTEQVWTAVAGSELVLVGGAKPVLADSAFNKTPHPRTAIGVSGDGRYLILLVIDGRRPGHSEGATMDEVAAWLVRFGATEGLNLDGGGSTSLVRAAGEEAVPLNTPSGKDLGSSGKGDERSNGNNLGVFARPLPAVKE